MKAVMRGAFVQAEGLSSQPHRDLSLNPDRCVSMLFNHVSQIES